MSWEKAESGARPLVAAGAALASCLVIVVWLDFRATRRELLGLLRDQASSLRQTVAVAARDNRAAARLVEGQLSDRLLDNARLLAEIDRRGALDGALLEDVVERHGLFRVAVYAPDGDRELSTLPGEGRGPGGGASTSLLGRVIDGGEAEATTPVHRSRRGAPRVGAAVRRAGGGAIVVNVDASAAAALASRVSREKLLEQIVASAPEVAYVVFEEAGERIARGEALPQADAELALRPGERERDLDGRPVLELAGPVALGDGSEAGLLLGMRLDGVRAAERRMRWQLGLTILVTLALGTLGAGVLWLRRQYGRLSERHARAEEALRRRDRLAAMGELASGVAHEIRNPLNAIAMSIKRLRTEREQAPGEAEELLEIVESQSRRIGATVEQFLAYARPRPPAPRRVDADALLREVEAGTAALAASRGVSLSREGPAAGEAVLDPDQIRQALDNLVRNAVEATPEGGRVTLTARRSGGGLVLTVSDTGSGIAPADLPRVFDLYFTTKPGGTGVGLAVTHQIVTAHGGRLDVASEPGRGTAVAVKLPAAGVEVAA